MRGLTHDQIIEIIDHDSAERTRRVRQFLMEEGRPDLLREFDDDMKKLRLGITGAQNCWHSLSAAQRRTIETLAAGRYRLARTLGSINFYDASGEPYALARVAGLKTVRNLAARELLDWDGTADDPERAAVLSDRGRFVLAHGRKT